MNVTPTENYILRVSVTPRNLVCTYLCKYISEKSIVYNCTEVFINMQDGMERSCNNCR